MSISLCYSCRLYNICPINGNEQSMWKSDDKVHDEFKRLMVNNVSCKLRSRQDQICYDIEINIRETGDFGTFLIKNNLASPTTISYSQRPNSSSGQTPQRSCGQAQVTSLGTTPSIQEQQIPTQQHEITTGLSSIILTVPLHDGYYWILQIYNAAEFYGFSQSHQREFEGVCKDLEVYYDNFVNDQSLNVTVILEGMLSVIQQCDKYYRVIIKNRESESKVLVKLIDRGDEIVVDTSKLLQSLLQRSLVHVHRIILIKDYLFL